MTIGQAIDKLNEIKSKKKANERTNKCVEALIIDLDQHFAKDDEVDADIVNRIEGAEDILNVSLEYEWAYALTEKFFEMRSKRKNELDRGNNKIDGETSQWIVTIVQAVVGIISIVFTILFALKKIPNVFGVLGENQNSDALYYIIGTVGQQVVALVIAIVIGITNRHRINKKYYEGNKDKLHSFDELLAYKYANKPKMCWLLSRKAAKIIKGRGNIVIDDINMSVHGGSTVILGNKNSINKRDKAAKSRK